MVQKHSDGSARPDQVASYVATMARDLKRLVRAHDLTTLAYLLDLVQLEAEQQAEQPLRKKRIA